MRWLGFTLVAFCLAFSPAWGGSPGPGYIEGVEWEEVPSGNLILNYYPEKAARRRINGAAVIFCRVRANGGVGNCHVASEGPEGENFGVATIAVSKHFKMATRTRDGRSTEGAVIGIPMSWVIERGQAVPRLDSSSPGRPAYIPTIESGGSQKGTFACPSKSEPERRCRAHYFSPKDQPSTHDIAGPISRADDGVTLMECTVEAAGSLSGCKIDTVFSEEDEAALLKAAAMFQIPPTTDDKVPTAGKRAVFTFDWKALRRVYEANLAAYEGK